jgi:hypothetical protein
MKIISIALFLLMSCGTSSKDQRTQPTDVADLQRQILMLQGTTDQLNSLVMSDFATCPNAGETADALVRKICQVAQAATAEQRVEFKGQISDFVRVLSERLESTNSQLGDLQTAYEANVISVTASLGVINASISTLQSNMTTAQGAITILQGQVASLSGSLNGTLQLVDVGSENLSAGPVYESLLRRSDKTRINAYIDAYSSGITLGSSTITATNASADVVITKPVTVVTVSNASPAVVTWTSHGWVDSDPVMFSTTGALPTGLTANTVYYVRNKTATTFNVSLTPTGVLINTSSAGSGVHSGALGAVAGDTIEVSSATGGRGFTNANLYGEFVVNAGATTSSCNITLKRTATSSGSLGGNSANVRRVIGRGLANIWKTADGADAIVRTTTIGTRRYNFIIKANGDVCYSLTVPLEIFATINGSGFCK